MRPTHENSMTSRSQVSISSETNRRVPLARSPIHLPLSASSAITAPCSCMMAKRLLGSAEKGEGLIGQISGRLLTSQGAMPSNGDPRYGES